MSELIHIVTTGGTIGCARIDDNKVYQFPESIIPELLQSQSTGNYPHWTHLNPIDSKYMTNTYREMIANECSSIIQKRILITHGTDTLVETAQYLQERVRNKIIVLVGAMIPPREYNSDAVKNLTYAIYTLRALQDLGVRIAMNDQVFFPDNVRKNREKMVFETLS